MGSRAVETVEIDSDLAGLTDRFKVSDTSKNKPCLAQKISNNSSR